MGELRGELWGHRAGIVDGLTKDETKLTNFWLIICSGFSATEKKARTQKNTKTLHYKQIVMSEGRFAE